MVTPIERAYHIKDTILTLRHELAGRTLRDLIADTLDWSGYRYLLLVISEAARNLPDDWQTSFGPDIAWRQVEDLGNALRHGYHTLDVERLWFIYTNDLDPLEAAVDRMIAAHGSTKSPNS